MCVCVVGSLDLKCLYLIVMTHSISVSISPAFFFYQLEGQLALREEKVRAEGPSTSV